MSSLPIIASEALAPRYVSLPLPSAVNVAFGSVAPSALLSIPTRYLGGHGAIEAWPAHDELTFGAIVMPETAALEDVAREAYARLLAETRAAGYPHLLRVWNHVGDINRIDAGQERYQ
ncbi:MAG TPA: hypothetical protein VF698_07340, partial [Thermoanaerobaculia bacterium]